MSEKKKNNLLNIALWAAQILLAGMFILAGAMKSFQPIATLEESLPWVANTPSIVVRFIGISELLGGIGLLLPSILRIRSQLTGYAALGLVLVMLFAFVFHLSRGEYSSLGVNVVTGLLAGFIAWGRLKKVPIHPRS
ncbi:DoxX family protein [Lewinella sp. JB7]|uniref:DoxX family protein n=1 Tax=Lewinella sp. JB7 TaxID=2962887 RepID=UPI0020C9D45A|nr:DoxX family protein [Lewinella sp. JB7]MCP9237111.1 DoxX family protein [Lewinella sp. JB7]